MSDNNIFFKHFFKSKDKLWNEIQNNPLAHRDLMPNWKPTNIPSFIAYDDGSEALLGLNTWHLFHNVLPTQIRVPAGQTSWNVGIDNKTIINNPTSALAYVKKLHGQIPPAMYFLPPPNTPGNLYANISAAIAADKFNIEEMKRTNTNYNWVKSDDYWLPRYEGNFSQLQEKQSRRPPRHYSDNQKVLSNVFDFKGKQKEAFVWLKADFT